MTQQIYSAAEIAACLVAGTLPNKNIMLGAGTKAVIINNDTPYTLTIDIPYSGTEFIPAFSRRTLPANMPINGNAEIKHVMTTPAAAYTGTDFICTLDASPVVHAPDLIPLGKLPAYNIIGVINP